jgi:hypothetical protein
MEQPCSGPHGNLRVCHEHISNQGGQRAPQNVTTHWCNLHGELFCWTCCRWYCSIHADARHQGHRLERAEG